MKNLSSLLGSTYFWSHGALAVAVAVPLARLSNKTISTATTATTATTTAAAATTPVTTITATTTTTL